MKTKPYANRMPVALTTLIILIFIASGCQPQATPELEHVEQAEREIPALAAVTPGEGEKLKVVATTNIVGDVVSVIGGDKIELITLMGIGVDPHTYVPTPSDIAAIHDAHVLFANGADLEADLKEVFESAGGDAVEVYVSHGLELREAEREHKGADPHVWFSVPNVIHWVKKIEHTLCALDPGNAQIYESNTEAYISELEELDAWVFEQIASIPKANRRLVTSHPALGYLAERYGMEQVGAVYPVSPSAEPSAQDIAALQEAIREYGVQAVFTESTVNPKLAGQVAKDTGIKLVALYTGSLGGPGSGAESYIEMMRYDVQAIVDALK